MPEYYVDSILQTVNKRDIVKKYDLRDSEGEWETAEEFLSILAKKKGKLLKGGEPDISTTARIVLYDWQRGRIPFFSLPPNSKETKKVNDQEGKEHEENSQHEEQQENCENKENSEHEEENTEHEEQETACVGESTSAKHSGKKITELDA